MRIAIDARELGGKPTGVGRYLKSLLQAWEHSPDAADHEFILCAPARPADVDLPDLPVRWVTSPGHGTLWEQWTLPGLVRGARADVMFAPAYSCPVFDTTPTVLAIHDVSFFAQPQSFAAREGLRRRVITRLSARRAARILTISAFSKREIVRWVGVGPDKVDIVYPGVTTLADAAPNRGRTGTGDALVLYVGSIFNRRHLPELIDGFAQLAGRHGGVRLELVGDNRSQPPIDLDAAVARTGLADRIRIRSYVSDSELATLYAEATAFAFLSDYEGFGLTPLEAMALDVPVVVLDTDVAREVYGSAARYVAAPDPGAIASALSLAIFHHPARPLGRAAGRATVARYSWTDCATRTLQTLVSCGTR
jgi:glycosyltransferase involved in cell wall biosynthesis